MSGISRRHFLSLSGSAAVAAMAALVLRHRFPHHLGPVPSRVRAAQ